MRTTTAAVVHDKGGPFRIQDVTVAEPRPGEVLVRLAASGICHTDLLARDRILPPQPPAILGHEGSGVIEAVGAAVDTVAVGDKVVLAPASCGTCRLCRTGHPMHCVSFLPLNLRGRRSDGSTAYHDPDGTELNAHFFGQSSFSRHVVADARSAVVVDDSAPLELLGPLGCGLQTGAGCVLNVLQPPPGSSIAVFGAGAVGLAAVMAARIAGCDRIIAVDLHAHRLETARELGATHAFDATNGDNDVVRRILDLTKGGADCTVDAVGHPRTVRNAVDALAVGGTAAVLGSGNGGGQEISLGLVQLFGRTVKGVLEGDSVPALLIPRLVGFFGAGRFPLDRIVTTYPFEEINKAAEDAAAGRTIKPVLVH
ncbi:NAD(P)-dependent alcohol dehydrogenase [Streptomyces sp. NPDC053048]|uniref:NAD(P)-dependent alcohol dehydrogenase n=1 Tax=Streptomyces sp. NPDC053048 TaxID=3365694 RepID=UPI0037D069F7